MEITEKLEPKFKEQWLAALRSGRYVQAEGVLCDLSVQDDKHHMCCLAVAEHICGTKPELMEEDEVMYFPRDLTNPKSPEILHEGEVAEYLASMNDGNKHEKIRKHSFEEIADYIEKNL